MVTMAGIIKRFVKIKILNIGIRRKRFEGFFFFNKKKKGPIHDSVYGLVTCDGEHLWIVY